MTAAKAESAEGLWSKWDCDRDLDDYFDFAIKVMKSNATYSMRHNAWVISKIDAQFVLVEHINYLQPTPLSLPEFLNEGVCRGLWDIQDDKEKQLDMVIIK